MMYCTKCECSCTIPNEEYCPSCKVRLKTIIQYEVQRMDTYYDGKDRTFIYIRPENPKIEETFETAFLDEEPQPKTYEFTDLSENGKMVHVTTYGELTFPCLLIFNIVPTGRTSLFLKEKPWTYKELEDE